MEDTKISFNSIDEYILQFPQEVQDILQKIRNVIKETAPESTEKISYQMPAFILNGNLVYFAGYKNHIGFYPTASGIAAFEHKLSKYKRGKGSVQFPLYQPIPYDLIKEIVMFKVEENKHKAEAKKKKEEIDM